VAKLEFQILVLVLNTKQIRSTMQTQVPTARKAFTVATKLAYGATPVKPARSLTIAAWNVT
jgi:hypothetical protein